MRKHTTSITLVAVLMLAAAVCGVTNAQGPLKVCPDPSAPCQSKHKKFEKYELSFALPKTIKPNVTYQSAPFYAVVLKFWAESDCDQGEYSSATEKFRLQAQKLFPDRKVFALNQCPDMGAVGYSINARNEIRPFVAVYGGETQADADQILAKAREKYKTARVVKMRASFERIEQ